MFLSEPIQTRVTLDIFGSFAATVGVHLIEDFRLKRFIRISGGGCLRTGTA